MKILFRDGREFHVIPNQLTKVPSGLRPNPPHHRKDCQALEKEAKLQLKRLDRELESL